MLQHPWIRSFQVQAESFQHCSMSQLVRKPRAGWGVEPLNLTATDKGVLVLLRAVCLSCAAVMLQCTC